MVLVFSLGVLPFSFFWRRIFRVLVISAEVAVLMDFWDTGISAT